MAPLREHPETDPGESVTIPPYDAWLIAQALSDKDIDASDPRISIRNRAVVRLIAETPYAGREQAWDELLQNLSVPEASAWIAAVSGVNPADPSPEDDTWGQPLAFKLPPVEPFPLETYPAACGRPDPPWSTIHRLSARLPRRGRTPYRRRGNRPIG